MNPFKVHSIESAPAESKPMLEASVKTYGINPNLHAIMAESPAMLEAYKMMHGIFATKTAFNDDELTVVWQTINIENNCRYCVPAHMYIAHTMNIDASITDALRNGTAMPNEKLQALQDMTLLIIRNKGVIAEEQMKNFFDAGYTTKHYMDILVGYAQKILSNYTNHAAQTELDAPFQEFA